MDICERKHGGNEASVIANDLVAPSKRAVRERVFEFVCAHHGVTSKDVQAHLRKMVYHPDSWPMNAFSGRLSELRDDGLIDSLPALRNGLQVWVKAEQQRQLLECA